MSSRWLDIVRLRIRSLMRRERVESDLDRELRSHLRLLVEENVAQGMSPADAHRAAARSFGGIEHVKDESRDARGVSVIENVGRDLRYTMRGLVRQPMLVVVATSSIALGVGGNIAVLSLAREFMFATPDARRPEELVRMQVSHGSHASYQRWRDIDASGALAQLAGYSIEKRANWLRGGGDAAVSITPMIVTANFFEVIGPPIALGRGFSAEEARPDRDPRVAVVSHSFWRRELAGDSAAVGRTLVLNGEPYRLLGVLAPNLRSVTGFGFAPPVYVPVSPWLVPEMDKAGAPVVSLLGRLKQGQTLAEGRAAVDAVDRRLGRAQGDTVYAGVQVFTRMSGPVDRKSTATAAFFAVLGLMSLFVLLIACANVAGLLVARGTARRREIAIRLAIGGSRRRLIQQLLTEGFWLALIGTAFGIALSTAFMRVANSIALPVPIPIELHLELDAGIFASAIGLVLLTMLLSALLPSLTATRLAITPALKRDQPRFAGRRFDIRGVLVTGQVTVSTILLATALLFLRNLSRTQLTNPGFEVEHALLVQIGFGDGRPGEIRTALLQRATERLAALPGVASAAYADGVPLTMSGGSTQGLSARIDGRSQTQHVQYARIFAGPGYFATMGIDVVQGREFAATDRTGSPRVAIVNEEFVRRYFGGEPAAGRRLQLSGGETPLDLEIVGVVKNGKYITLGEQERAALYFPLLQRAEPPSVAFLVARTHLEPTALVATARRALGEMDRSVAVEVQPMREALVFALLPSQIGAVVLGTLGTIGFVLAMLGLYAIVSYNVGRRVGEIAIRTALGATRWNVIRLIVRDATTLVGVGVLVGLGVAALVTRPLSIFLVAGLSPTDPLSYAGTAGAFVLVTILASWLPARRAMRVNPVLAMRLE
jgi:predicted permease